MRSCMKKLSISLLLLAIMIMSISAVSAADADVSDDLVMSQDDLDTLEIDSTNDDVSQVASVGYYGSEDEYNKVKQQEYIKKYHSQF